VLVCLCVRARARVHIDEWVSGCVSMSVRWGVCGSVLEVGECVYFWEFMCQSMCYCVCAFVRVGEGAH